MILHRPLDPATKATVSCEWQHAPFSAPWSQTRDLLQFEAAHLTGDRRCDVFVVALDWAWRLLSEHVPGWMQSRDARTAARQTRTLQALGRIYDRWHR